MKSIVDYSRTVLSCGFLKIENVTLVDTTLVQTIARN